MKPRVYQASDGKWIVLVGETKTYFLETEELEARQMASKVEFASDIQEFCTGLVDLFKDAPDLESVYFDRGYNGGGIDPIIDGDVSGLGITAAQIASGITLIQQLQNFADNSAVVTGDYSATANALRTDR